jgi:hypothetical protein
VDDDQKETRLTMARPSIQIWGRSPLVGVVSPLQTAPLRWYCAH